VVAVAVAKAGTVAVAGAIANTMKVVLAIARVIAGTVYMEQIVEVIARAAPNEHSPKKSSLGTLH